jgi:hypothetical protein
MQKLDEFFFKFGMPPMHETRESLLSNQKLDLEYCGGKVLRLSDPDTLWPYVPLRNVGTIQLYIHGLIFLDPMIEEFRITGDTDLQEAIRRISASLLKFMGGGVQLPQVESKQGSEHIIACRTIVLLKVLTFINLKTDFKRELEQYVRNTVPYLLNKELYVPGNHGVMTDQALLHLAQYFSGESESRGYQRVALRRLEHQISIAYDADGFINENTIAYQNVNNMLYQEVCDFCARYHLESSTTRSISKTVEMGVIAFKKSLLHNGKCPSIGDSHESKNAATPYLPIIGKHLFKHSGFFFDNTDGTFFSFNCGCRSEIHKHIDDTSIILKYLEKDIFVDSGFYGYDRTDPLYAAIHGSRGHSAIFPTFLDCELSTTAYVKSMRNAAITSCNIEPNGFIITGLIDMPIGDNGDTLRITRTVTKENRRIVIDDSWESNGMPEIRQRFCLHPDASVIYHDVYNEGILIVNDNIYANIAFECDAQFSINLRANYYAPRPFTATHNVCIDCIANDYNSTNASIRTIIAYGNVGEIIDIEECACASNAVIA